jgi:hypothetical protein
MKKLVWLVVCVCCVARIPSARAREFNHFPVGAFADYFRSNNTGTNMFRVGGRFGVSIPAATATGSGNGVRLQPRVHGRIHEYERGKREFCEFGRTRVAWLVRAESGIGASADSAICGSERRICELYVRFATGGVRHVHEPGGKLAGAELECGADAGGWVGRQHRASGAAFGCGR